MKHLVLYLLAAAIALSLAGCGGSSDVPTTQTFLFSFETGFDGWDPDATVLTVASQPMSWSITRSLDRATDGTTSFKFSLNNLSDFRMIWIKQPFNARPNTTYRVDVDYDFATADFGHVNPWRILTGVLPTDPQNAADVVPFAQGTTGNGANTDVGFVWLPKSYQFTTQSDNVGLLYVFIGVWGTSEFSRTYYVDNVHIKITEQ